MRGVGAIEALRAILPEAAVASAAVLTHLGDPALLVALVVVAYWRGHPGAPRLLAVGLAAVGLTLALKGLFVLSRPPPPLRAVAADGYGFPSGHATGAAAVYGGLALTLDWRSTRGRLLAAGAVVAVVAVARVVLGVHYLADVAAGVVAGTAVLVATWRLSRTGWRPRSGSRPPSGLLPPPSMERRTRCWALGSWRARRWRGRRSWTHLIVGSLWPRWSRLPPFSARSSPLSGGWRPDWCCGPSVSSPVRASSRCPRRSPGCHRRFVRSSRCW